MSSKSLDDLRTHLFETLEGLKNKDKPLDIERAKAVCQVAGQIIETAKVEVAFVNAVGGKGSGFIPDTPTNPRPGLPGSPTRRLEQK